MFYLIAAFCFGHLINEGLQLGQQIMNYMQDDRFELGCVENSAIILHTLKPLYSFYQLFIVFKYSNVSIYSAKYKKYISLKGKMSSVNPIEIHVTYFFFICLFLI